MAIELSKEDRKVVVSSLQKYFQEKLEIELTGLQADLLLGFFVQEIGGTIYNRAIRDAQTFLQERALDLESSCFEPEFTYWAEKRRSRQG